VSIVFIDELRPAGIWNCPGYRERIKACAIGVVGAFTFERRKGVHEGDSDVGKDSATARGNLILGERRGNRWYWCPASVGTGESVPPLR
jgi:hypothetical protein